MARHRYHRPGTAPATLVAPDDAAGIPSKITLIEYDAQDLVEREVTDVQELRACGKSEKVTWINVDGLGDVELLRTLGGMFGLHPLALEDVLHTEQRPKVEAYEDHLFVVLQMAQLLESEIDFEQVSLFLGKNFLITFQERPGDAFGPVRERLKRGRGYARTRGNDYLAYALIDSIVDHYFPVLEDLGEVVERLEDQLVDNPCESVISEVHELKRVLLHVRRAAWPQREVLSALGRDETGVICQETHVFLRDCYDHTVQILDMAETFRDMAAGMMDLYLSSVSNRTNEVMRVLTVIASIFIPLTFIAGVYGMNFDPAVSRWNMPELGARYGYPICLGAMLLTGIGMVLYFRKKGWF